jgi:tetratricopeptide (TPR) repeat protein/predicted Ser/Thr protein kinase
VESREPIDPTVADPTPVEVRHLGAVEHERLRQSVYRRVFGASSPVEVGRFTVLERIGSGGMGLVFKAYDMQLDRKVAVKVIRVDGASDAARRALVKEARALARLSHPNVVNVYEIGELDDQLFVAMEFLSGPTLRAWLDEGPRAWADVLAVYRQAGEGLAAAHAEGIIHRDFKPHNAMFGADRRVRVLDFGLARLREVDQASRVALEEHAGPVDVAITVTGALLGTPAYMSPEQLAGRPADASSDQFGFCVALYEALYGERPFAGSTLRQLVFAVKLGRIEDAPRGSEVPTWLRKVVVRGLANAPGERWPSMRALLVALADDPVLRRRRWGAAAIVVGLLGGTAWGLVQAVQQDAQTCLGMQTKLDGVWNDERRSAVAAAIEGTGLGYAPGVWERVEQGLDDYASRWIAARVEACEATHRGEQSGELLDLRMACLDERLVQLRATVDVLAQADQTVVSKAVEMMANLPGLERCADTDALTNEIALPEDPEVAKQVAALDEQLADAKALYQAGKYLEGLAIADTVVTEAQQLGYEPLQVRAWLVQGSLQRESGDQAGAEATLERAFAAAIALRMPAEAAEASSVLMHVVGVMLARHEDGRRWAKIAQPASRAAGTDEASASYLGNIGNLANSEGKYDEAREYQAQALALRERSLGPNHPSVALTLSSLGLIAQSNGDYDDAREYLERALIIYEKALGPNHPRVASTLGSFGTLMGRQGKYEEARGYLERALAIYGMTPGVDASRVAGVLSNLGVVAELQGRYADARGYLERVLAIQEQTLGPEHPDVATALGNLGALARSEGNYDEARRYHERALAISEKALGPDHPSVAKTLNSLGSVARLQGRFDEARALHERALAINEKALGPDDPVVAIILASLSFVASGQGKYDEARKYLERALAIQEKTLDPGHPDVAKTLTSLGNVTYDQGARKDARRYFGQALDIYEKALGPDHPEVAIVLTSLGNMLADEANYEEARTYYERALAIDEKTNPGHPTVAMAIFNLGWLAMDEKKYEQARADFERALIIQEKALGPEHPAVAESLYGIGRAVQEVDIAAAIPYFERAVAVHAASGGDPAMLAESRFGLARVLWDAPADRGRDRVRARELAALTRPVYAVAGVRYADTRKEVDAFLARR